MSNNEICDDSFSSIIENGVELYYYILRSYHLEIKIIILKVSAHKKLLLLKNTIRLSHSLFGSIFYLICQLKMIMYKASKASDNTFIFLI